LALVTSNASPDTHFIGDIVYLEAKNDLLVYSKTLEMGAVGLITSSHLTDQATQAARQYLPAMMNEDRVEVAISLFVQSQKRENDNLRAFIAAWSALELLTNRLSKVVRTEREKQLQRGVSVSWDKDLRNVRPEDYRMRDRFLSVASILDPAGASIDLQTFVRVNDKRSGFYHRMDVPERDLPTNEVQMLFRKYLRLNLAAQTPASPEF
jgi:hypothetical protein